MLFGCHFFLIKWNFKICVSKIFQKIKTNAFYFNIKNLRNFLKDEHSKSFKSLFISNLGRIISGKDHSYFFLNILKICERVD